MVDAVLEPSFRSDAVAVVAEILAHLGLIKVS